MELNRLPQGFLEATRFCRAGDPESIRNLLDEDTVDIWMKTFISQKKLLNSGMPYAECRRMYRHFDPASGDVMDICTQLGVAVLSGSNEMVDFFLDDVNYFVYARDIYVIMMLGDIRAMRKLVEKDNTAIFKIFGYYNFANLLGKAAYNSFLSPRSDAYKIIDYIPKLELACEMGVTMHNVEHMDNRTPLFHFIDNRVPFAAITGVIDTLSKRQLQHVNDMGESFLFSSIAIQDADVSTYLLDKGVYLKESQARANNDVRFRRCPTATLLRHIWRKPIEHYKFLLELAKRNVRLEEFIRDTPYVIENIHVCQLMRELGVTLRLTPDFVRKAKTDTHIERGQWLSLLVSTPKSPKTLQNMCRRLILDELPQYKLITESLAKLQVTRKVTIPQPIIDFLSYAGEGYLVEEYRMSSKANPIPGWYGSDDPKNFFDKTVEYI